MKFTKPITSCGYTATPEQLQAAWDEWRSKVSFDMNGYASGLESIVWEFDKNNRNYSMRMADRMIQMARKAGHIKYINGRWVDQ